MNLFNSVPMPKVPGSKFNLSHVHKTTFEIGQLIPTCVMEVLPGDKFDIGVEIMTRMAPMVAPVYADLDVTTHYFFVPNRIMWPLWDDWITGKTEVIHPRIVINDTLDSGDLGSYLGYKQQNNIFQNVFPLAAYCMIYDEFYRAQHIETTEQFTELVASGNPTYLSKATSSPLTRAWNHDYFTSALPFPQVSDAVELPILATNAIDVDLKDPLSGFSQLFRDNGGNLDTNVTGLQSDPTTGVVEDQNGGSRVYLDPNGTMEVDFTGVIPDINSLREALALQRWLEKEARAGQRYIEWIGSMFGERVSDYRLQRPEYLCGHKQSMQISEVLTTAESSGNPVGNMQGHGISVGGSKTKSFKFEEHGWLLGITSVLPKTGYYQGIHRSISHRVDRYDYANPMFARLGEQEIYNKEIYLSLSDTQETADSVFGYIPRFAEYKHQYNKVSGEFMGTLDYWHMDRKFASAPALNPSFIKCEHDNRNFASVEGTDTIYAMVYNKLWAYRKLPKYAIPSIV